MKESYSLSFLKGVLIPLLLWLVFTPWSAALDLKISQIFYKNGSFVSHPFWNWLYIYGLWPAWLLVGLALIGFILSFFKKYRSWRKPCLFLCLTLAIGAELIINLSFKDHWGRPRPVQIEEFGGRQAFRSYYQPNIGQQPEPSKSFACGHASMGFFFFSVALLGIFYRSKILYWLGMGLAWGLGGLLSLARIAQGGHFLSDTIASALIMWLTAWGLGYLLFLRQPVRKECDHEGING